MEILLTKVLLIIDEWKTILGNYLNGDCFLSGLTEGSVFPCFYISVGRESVFGSVGPEFKPQCC